MDMKNGTRWSKITWFHFALKTFNGHEKWNKMVKDHIQKKLAVPDVRLSKQIVQDAKCKSLLSELFSYVVLKNPLKISDRSRWFDSLHVCPICRISYLILCWHHHALINRARGTYEEIFVLIFKAYGPNAERTMSLECQNKYSPYEPKSRLIRASLYTYRNKIVYDEILELERYLLCCCVVRSIRWSVNICMDCLSTN